MGKKKFNGDVGRTLLDTKYSFEEIPSGRRADAPNVLFIVLDDLGFAHLGCYGSNIDTPNIDRLASGGLRYNNFHTTAVCSATRASLLTGANHHSVGVASLVDMATGLDNGLGHVDSSYATLAEILHEYDYDTLACGKWHLANNEETTAAGPFDNWPLGKGFGRYYGYLQAMTNQWNPLLVQDNSLVSQPKAAAEGYHLSEDLTDHAIDFLSTQKNAHPDKPFFLYLAYGAMHAPHHAPKSYIDKYRGRFDEGWDVLREKWFENQKKLGIIPQNTVLNPRNEYVPAWDDLSDDQKKISARYMEAYAGMLDHVDEQIGRVIHYLEDINQLDNTVIVFLSDNGTSSEGGPDGRFNQLNGYDMVSSSDTTEEMLEKIDLIGSEYAYNHYPSGWANLGNTPFPWFKYWVHSGGVKDPMIIHYPDGIKDRGGIRSQYHHVIDIVPTILDIIGVKKPEIIKGVPQKPIQGKSLKYTFDHPSAESVRTKQYFELLGNRAIYKDGWKAVVNHTFNESFDEDKWELYHVDEDFSESNDVAEQYPQKLRELQDEFFIEAGKYGVFPQFLNNHLSGSDALAKSYGDALFFPAETREYHNIYRYFDLPKAPRTDGNSFAITARINRRAETESGVIYAAGDRFGGWSFYIKENQLRYTFNRGGKAQFNLHSEETLPVGRITVKLEVRILEEKNAQVQIFVENRQVGSLIINGYYGTTSGFGFNTIGANRYCAVSEEYESPFVFQGNIEYVKVHTADAKASTKEELDKFFAVD